MDDDRPLVSEIAQATVGRVRFLAVAESARPCPPIALAGLPNESRGGGPAPPARTRLLVRRGPSWRGSIAWARLAGIVARPVHGPAIDTPRPAGCASAYRGRMPRAATVV